MHGRPNIVPDRRSANIVHTHRTIRLLTTYRAVYRPVRTQIKRLHYYRIHPLLPEQYNNFLYSKHTAQKNLLQITLILSLGGRLQKRLGEQQKSWGLSQDNNPSLFGLGPTLGPECPSRNTNNRGVREAGPAALQN